MERNRRSVLRCTRSRWRRTRIMPIFRSDTSKRSWLSRCLYEISVGKNLWVVRQFKVHRGQVECDTLVGAYFGVVPGIRSFSDGRSSVYEDRYIFFIASLDWGELEDQSQVFPWPYRDFSSLPWILVLVGSIPGHRIVALGWRGYSRWDQILHFQGRRLSCSPRCPWSSNP